MSVRLCEFGARISGGIFGPGVGIGLRKLDEKLVNDINHALDALKKEGSLKTISMKSFGISLTDDQPLRLLQIYLFCNFENSKNFYGDSDKGAYF